MLRRRAGLGDAFKVVGGAAALGRWAPDVAPRMAWSDGDVWTLVARLPPGEHEFKAALRAADGAYTWEAGPDRAVVVPPPGAAPAEVEVALDVRMPWDADAADAGVDAFGAAPAATAAVRGGAESAGAAALQQQRQQQASSVPATTAPVHVAQQQQQQQQPNKAVATGGANPAVGSAQELKEAALAGGVEGDGEAIIAVNGEDKASSSSPAGQQQGSAAAVVEAGGGRIVIERETYVRG